MKKIYVLSDGKSIIGANHPRPEAICEISKDLARKAFKIIDVDVIENQIAYARDGDGDIIIELKVDGDGLPIMHQPTDEFGNPDGDPVQAEGPIPILDGDGNLTFEDVVIGTKKEAVLDDDAEVERLMDVEEDEMDQAFAPIQSINILEALVEAEDGDKTKFNELIDARKFIAFADYRKAKMRKDKKNMMIIDDAGVFKIQEFDVGIMPSNFVRMAPKGFLPGDEDCLTHLSGKSFSIDFAKRIDRFKSRDKSVEKARRDDEWNTKSPLERIKEAVIG